MQESESKFTNIHRVKLGPKGGGTYIWKNKSLKISWSSSFNTITYGMWADQPTDFILAKAKNSWSLKNLEKYVILP